jgi:hypothetical protein
MSKVQPKRVRDFFVADSDIDTPEKQPKKEATKR